MVEDSPSDADLVLRHLHRSDIEVDAVRVDTLSALEQALGEKVWDAILCDYCLPGFSAEQVLATLAATRRPIPLIVVSGTVPTERAIELMRRGARDYVPKSNLARLGPCLQREIEEARVRAERERSESERLRLEGELRSSERRYKMLFDSFGDALLILDLDGRIVNVNETTCSQLHKSRSDLLHRQLADLDMSGVHPGVHAARLDAVRGFGHTSFELLYVCPDHTHLVFDTSLRIIEYGSGAAILVVAREVSEHKRIGDELRELTAELEQRVATRTDELKRANTALEEAKAEAERANRAKSHFLARMSHEIRTPLNAILGYSQLLLRDAVMGPQDREQLRTINRSGEHLLALISDILEMSKIEAGGAQINAMTFDLGGLVHDIAAMFKLRAQNKGLSLFVCLDNALPPAVVADESKLRQIFINLLGNAVKFTQCGQITWHVRTEPGRLITTVKDTGPGIDPADMQRLFEKFTQTSLGVRAGGSGLGLAISREFARLMGGEITVDSQPGKGSRFHLDVPFVEGRVAELAARTSCRSIATIKPGSGPWRVLVVDDQEDSRALLVKILSSVGFQTYEATDGAQAVACFENIRPHAVLMDLRMPAMDGFETTRRIKQSPRGARTPIIAVTASTFEDDRRRALDGNMDDFVAKPFHDTEVLETLGARLGVEYLYMDGIRTPTPTMLPIADASSDENLSHVSSQLLDELRSATVAAEYDRALELVGDLAATVPATAEELRRLVRSFDYQGVIDRLGT
jgi:PAS domain S-box-containing protein